MTILTKKMTFRTVLRSILTKFNIVDQLRTFSIEFRIIYSVDFVRDYWELLPSYRVCHGFSITKRDDFFRVHFWTFLNRSSVVFWGSWGSIENWLKPKIKPPIQILACVQIRETLCSSIASCLPVETAGNLLLSWERAHARQTDWKHDRRLTRHNCWV